MYKLYQIALIKIRVGIATLLRHPSTCSVNVFQHQSRVTMLEIPQKDL